MKRIVGIYLMVAAILMGVYLIFDVYLPGVVKIGATEVGRKEPDASIGIRSSELGDKLPTPYSDTGIGPLPPNSHAFAKVVPHKRQHAVPIFSVPSGLEDAVSFWKEIYSKYTSDQAVLHYKNGFKIIKVVDLPHCDEPPTVACQLLREETMEAEKRGFNSIRAQVGQKDRFAAGINASLSYMPRIEEIFANYNLPKELTRIVFVESMFNLKARSKVGAAGIWQFTRGTGKKYLRIDGHIDERYDPFASTHAAAQLLKKNYEELGTWPLAINAYNSGRARLKEAVAMLGTTDIVAIIRGYDHPDYGFASKNFYAEFLAALDVYENRELYFKMTNDKIQMSNE